MMKMRELRVRQCATVDATRRDGRATRRDATRSMSSTLNQRIVGVSHTDVERGTTRDGETLLGGSAASSSAGAATTTATTPTSDGTPTKRARPHSHNYSGPTPRALKAFLVASILTLLALITTASTSGKIEELRASLASGFFDDDDGNGRVVMDGSAPRRDCGLTQEAWNRAVGLERHDPCRDAFVRGDGETTTAYAERREALGVPTGEEEWALVTGGAGFIGAEVVRQLLAIGVRVRALDDLSTGKRAHLDFAADAQKAGKFELVEGDVTKYKHVQQAMKDVTYVFHLAAVSKVKPTLDPTKDDVVYACLETNVKGTENVLRAVRARDAELATQSRRVRFVYAGSSTYYGNQPTPFDEERTHLRTTTTPYATTKAQGEDLARLYYSMYDVEAVVARLFMVYGANEPTEGDQAVVTGRFIDAAVSNRAFEIEGDGSQFRDFVHVEDAARGLILAALKDSAVGRTFNIGSGSSTTVSDLADMISRKLPRNFVEPRQRDLKGTLASTCLAKRVLGFQARKTLVDYIADVKASKGL